MKRALFFILMFICNLVTGQQSFLEIQSSRNTKSFKTNGAKVKIEKRQMQPYVAKELSSIDTLINKINKVNKLNKENKADSTLQKEYFILYKKHLALEIQNGVDQLDSLIVKYKIELNEIQDNYTIAKKPYQGETPENLYKRDSLLFELNKKNIKTLAIISEYEGLISKSKSIISTITKNRYTKNLDEEIKDLDKEIKNFKSFENKFNELEIKIKKALLETEEEYTSKIDAIKPEEEIEENLISSLPEFLVPVGNSVLIPSFNLLGHSNFIWETFEGNLKVFTSSVNKEKNDDYRSLLIPEAGSFGVVIDFFKYFKKETEKSKFALHGFASYVQKNTYKINEQINVIKKSFDTTEVKHSQFHLKLGGEYVFVKDVFSVYADYNSIRGVTGISNFSGSLDFLSKNSKVGFYNTGVKFKIATTKKLKTSKSYILMDLNFIWLNKIRSQNYTKSRDLVIPILKTGIRI